MSNSRTTAPNRASSSCRPQTGSNARLCCANCESHDCKAGTLAVERLQRDSCGKLRRLQQAISELARQLEPSSSESTRASVSEIYADLVALHDEFDEVSFDRQARTISVTTEPIELEGVHLGPFEIRLDWTTWRTAPRTTTA